MINGTVISLSWASLVISGKNLNLKEVTKILELQPDYFHDKETTKTNQEPLDPVWVLNSTLAPEQDVESHLWELLKKIAARRIEFKDICQKYQATFYCNIELNKSNIKLSPRLLTLIGSLGAYVEISAWEKNPT